MFLISLSAVALLLIVIAKLSLLSRQQQKIYSEVRKLNEELNKLSNESIKSLKFNTVLIQYCLTCLRPYILSIQNNAIKREDYREAGECQKLIETITSLIQHSN